MQTLTQDMTADEITRAIDHDNRVMFAQLALEEYDRMTQPKIYFNDNPRPGARD